MINTRKVANFIDDIIMDMEEEEGHDEVVEEVVKILVENDFYIKIENTSGRQYLTGQLPRESKIFRNILNLPTIISGLLKTLHL